MTRVLESAIAKFRQDSMAHPVPLSPELSGLITDACFPPVPGLAKLVLVNSKTDRPIKDLELVNTVDLTKVGKQLNIEAIPAGPVGSVVFNLDGKDVATESASPLCIGGDSGAGKYADWTLNAGDHVLLVTPYREPQGKGDAGPALSVKITVIQSITPPPPVGPDSVPPPGAVVVRKTDDLSDAVAKLKDGQTLALERGGVWRESLALMQSAINIVPFGTGERPLIIADNGIMVVRGGLHDIIVKGIDVRGSASTPGTGISGFVNQLKNLRFEDVTVQGFRNSLSFHCPKMDAALPSDFLLDFAFVNCRFLDSSGPNERDGQGGYFQNLMGLSFLECLFDRCGMNRMRNGIQVNGQYAHGLYDQHGNHRVQLRRNIFSRCESMGSQSRGYMNDSHLLDPNDDPGPLVDSNIYIDCAIGLLVNGPKATAVKNIVQPGHFHNEFSNHGQGAVNAHIGSGLVADNICLGGPAPQGKDWKMPAFTVGPRPQSPPAHLWPWDKPTKPEIVNNVEYADVNLLPNLLNLVTVARSGVALGGVRDSMEMIVRNEIKGKTGVLYQKGAPATK